MPIGIIGAMSEEVELLIAKLKNITTTTAAGLSFHCGYLGSNEVIVVQSGIGKVNAAICAQLLISVFKAKCIINTGVAGGLCPKLNIGDVVVSTKLVQHDMDVTHFGYERGIVPGIKKDFFDADKTLQSLALKAAETCEATVTPGIIASGDSFVSSSKVKQDIVTNFAASCVEMEGAAIAQTCYLNNTPFIVIRAISDKADETATLSFDEFLKFAARNSAALVEKIITQI